MVCELEQIYLYYIYYMHHICIYMMHAIYVYIYIAYSCCCYHYYFYCCCHYFYFIQPDVIPQMVLIEVVEEIAMEATPLFQASLDDGNTPSNWCKIHVIQIY